MADIQVYDTFLLGIKVELFSIDYFWHQPRGKGVVENVCVVI